MKLSAVAVLVTCAVLGLPAVAQAAELQTDPLDYDVVCTQLMADGGPVGPKVCVPIPVQR